ncbi:hypothetical protein LCGC14_2411350, partial [marine sediment metagenome]
MKRLDKGFQIALVALTMLVVGTLWPSASLFALPVFFGMASESTTTALIDEALKIIFAKSLHNDIVSDSE